MYDSAHNGNGFVGWDADEGEGGREERGQRESERMGRVVGNTKG